MSGMIVDRRDHVLITALEFLSFAESTFLSRWSSTNGPFLRLRGISCLPSCSVVGGCVGVLRVDCGLRGHGHRFLPLRRRRTMSLSLSLFGRRVRPSGLPAGFTGWRPPEVLPSPPPCG